MNVNLGVLEITDDERRRIGRGGKLATREDIREWAFAILINTLDSTKQTRKAKAALRRAAGLYTEFEKERRKRR
jgi:hypothetical protein